MRERETFTVVECVRRFAWGGTYLLRLDADIWRSEEWLGYDPMGAPALLNRTFFQQQGWETQATLIGRDLQSGDIIGVDEVIRDARLWTEGRGRAAGG